MGPKASPPEAITATPPSNAPMPIEVLLFLKKFFMPLRLKPKPLFFCLISDIAVDTPFEKSLASRSLSADGMDPRYSSSVTDLFFPASLSLKSSGICLIIRISCAKPADNTLTYTDSIPISLANASMIAAIFPPSSKNALILETVPNLIAEKPATISLASLKDESRIVNILLSFPIFCPNSIKLSM